MKLKPKTVALIIILGLLTACVVVVGSNNEVDSRPDGSTNLDIGNKNIVSDSIKSDTTKIQ